MFDYPALAALAAIVREGSFERAASKLNVTPSAISQRIKLLEERTGQILVIRGQPCTPTEAGQQLCQHVERVHLMETELTDAWQMSVAEIREFEPVTVPVAVNADSLATWFVTAAARFTKRTGHLLDLVPDDQEHTQKKLRDGEVFAAVTSASKPVRGCRATPLGALTYCAAATPEFVADHFPEGARSGAFQRAPGIAFDRKDALPEQWMQSALGAAVEFPRVWVPSAHGILDAAVAGMGWALHPVALVEQHLQSGRLVEIIPGHRINIHLFWQVRLISSDLLADLTNIVARTAKDALTARSG